MVIKETRVLSRSKKCLNIFKQNELSVGSLFFFIHNRRFLIKDWVANNIPHWVEEQFSIILAAYLI